MVISLFCKAINLLITSTRLQIFIFIWILYVVLWCPLSLRIELSHKNWIIWQCFNLLQLLPPSKSVIATICLVECRKYHYFRSLLVKMSHLLWTAVWFFLLITNSHSQTVSHLWARINILNEIIFNLLMSDFKRQSKCWSLITLKWQGSNSIGEFEMRRELVQHLCNYRDIFLIWVKCWLPFSAQYFSFSFK